MQENRVMNSEYMQWAKSHAQVKYNLAVSGVPNYPFSKLHVKLEDLAITGDSRYGYEPLQEAIARKCGVQTDKVFSTIGTSLGNHLAMAVMIQPGDDILIEQPTYELLISTARYLGANVNRFPRRFENKFQIDPDDIRKSITPKTKLIVITNLHNPSSVLTEERILQEIGAIAQRVGSHVLVDEVYLDAAFDVTPRSSIHLGDEFIVTNSLTKVYGLSGLRCGWILAKPRLIKTMWHLNDLFEVIPPHPSELLSVIALNNLDEIAADAQALLTKNHKTLNDFLGTRSDLEYVKPDWGTVLFPRLKSGGVDRLSEILLNKFETVIVPGRYFEMPDHFRLGISCASEVFQAGISNLEEALDELSQQHYK
jgi:aspartate/methionine/tyrosine aminotransferase